MDHRIGTRIVARFTAAGLLLAASLGSTAAGAEPSVADKVSARAWMANGRTLRSQGHLDSALSSFKAADGIMRVPTTGLEVARTLDAMGRLVEAYGVVRRVLTTPLTTSDPLPFQSALSAAAALSTDLEHRIPTLTFVLEGFDGIPAVAVDGRTLAPTELAVSLRLDPGVHRVLAHFGELDATQVVELRERDRQPIIIKSPRVRSGAAAPSDARSGWQTIAYVSFGTSAAGLLVGTVTGALAMSAKSAADASCHDGRCTDDGSTSRRYGAASAAGFATFGTALGLGFMSLALMPSRESTAGASLVRVRPSVGGIGGVGGGSLELEGTF